METTYSNDRTILYLQLDEKIDRDFIHLASRLRNRGITLVPVKPSELDYFLASRMVPVVLLTKTISQHAKFMKVKKRWVDFFLKSRKIQLIHLNSFSEIRDYIQLKPKRFYINLNLPMTMKQVFQELESVIGPEGKKESSWPGGKRAKLPIDVSRG